MECNLKIRTKDAVCLKRIAESGQCFRWTSVDDGFLIPYREHDLFVRQDDPFTLMMSCTEDEYHFLWKDYFDLGTDYDALCSNISIESDPFLFEAIREQRGIRILKQDPWEMLITSIITQNRNIPAIQKSVALLSEKAGTMYHSVTGNRFYAFPTPAQLARLSDEDLCECKLGYRMKYVRAAACSVASGDLDLEMLKKATDEECEKKLIMLPGIGVKVAACILLFGFHRLNAFPIDVWVKRILENEYPNGYPKKAYTPYNGLYQQYMFAYYRAHNA